MSGDEPAMKQMAASMAGREPVAAGQEREIVMADFEGTPVSSLPKRPIGRMM